MQFYGWHSRDAIVATQQLRTYELYQDRILNAGNFFSYAFSGIMYVSFKGSYVNNSVCTLYITILVYSHIERLDVSQVKQLSYLCNK